MLIVTVVELRAVVVFVCTKEAAMWMNGKKKPMTKKMENVNSVCWMHSTDECAPPPTNSGSDPLFCPAI